MGFVRSKYTWSKHFDNGVSIWERLDRGMANNSWFLKFPGAKVHHLSCNTSDHLPLFFNLFGLEIYVKQKIFKFEEMWLSNSRCGETVEVAWRHLEGRNSDNIILQKVAKCEKDLTWWNNNCFGNVQKELGEKKEQLAKVERIAMVSGDHFLVWKLKGEINVLLDREARMWNQRSRVLWLNNGDNNTKYFHSKATKRFWRNYIIGIQWKLGGSIGGYWTMLHLVLY